MQLSVLLAASTSIPPGSLKTSFAGGLTGDHDTIVGLHGLPADVVEEASDKKRACAGASGSGRQAGRRRPDGESTAEQASAQPIRGRRRIRRVPVPERALKKIGFPYILAVRGRQGNPRQFRAGWTTPESEFAEALKQVHRIALLHIEAIFQEEE